MLSQVLVVVLRPSRGRWFFNMTILGLLVLFAFFFLPGWSDTCTSDSDPCKAKCSGSSFDLTGILNGRSIKDTSEGYVYSFTCGKGKKCGSKSNSVVCQVKQDGREWSLGVANSTEWTLISSNPIHLQIVFSKGDGEDSNLKSSDVSVVVNKTSQTFVFIGEDKSKALYEFSLSTTADKLYARSASNSVPVGIIGWTIIALALLISATYFIVGAIVMFKVKGARGVEIIPQYSFWKDFPLLIVDGMFFVISPCYKRSQYQKI